MMTIGGVLEALKSANPEGKVRFAFGYAVPTTVDSWRGIYAEAALGYKYTGRGTDAPTAAQLIAELEKAIDGKKFAGWKGGTFKYTKKTPLHIDNPGEYSCTEIVRIEVDGYYITIHTAKEE